MERKATTQPVSSEAVLRAEAVIAGTIIPGEEYYLGDDDALVVMADHESDVPGQWVVRKRNRHTVVVQGYFLRSVRAERDRKARNDERRLAAARRAGEVRRRLDALGLGEVFRVTPDMRSISSIFGERWKVDVDIVGRFRFDDPEGAYVDRLLEALEALHEAPLP